jgi:hypothetical protein
VKAIDEASGQKCFWEGSISAIYVVFSEYPNRLDLILLYLLGPEAAISPFLIDSLYLVEYTLIEPSVF